MGADNTFGETNLNPDKMTDKEYSSCTHPEKYRFIDRDGNLRCSSCHKVIEESEWNNLKDFNKPFDKQIRL